MSADISFPEQLLEQNHAVAPVMPYALGRLVLWMPAKKGKTIEMLDLLDPSIGKITIANPRHAPYGARGKEALMHLGLWDTLQSKLVFGENISQSAQFVQTGNAQAGLIALSLVLHPRMQAEGAYVLIPAEYHLPLLQAMVVTRKGGSNPAVKKFVNYLQSKEALKILARYGFTPPGQGVIP
jgi:molybdate transport system substrate-binding protein